MTDWNWYFSSLKFIFSMLLTGLVGTIFGVFYFKNENMKYSKKDIEEIEKYTKLENYSEYLKNYIENTSTTFE